MVLTHLELSINAHYKKTKLNVNLCLFCTTFVLGDRILILKVLISLAVP